MNFLKGLVAKLGTGFLYGIGFVIALRGIGSLAFDFYQPKERQTKYESATARETSEKEIGEGKERADQPDGQFASVFVRYDESGMLSAKVTRERVGNGEFTLLGTVENNGKNIWTMINLKADLYDKTGNFIEQCEEYANERLSPGKRTNFKLSCGNCSKLSLDGYDNYKLTIVDAHHRR